MSENNLDLTSGRIIELSLDASKVNHNLKDTSGSDLAFFSGEVVTLSIGMANGSIPANAKKLRIVAKDYLGSGRVGNFQFLGKDVNLSENEHLPLAVTFLSENTGAEAGKYLISFLFADAQNNFLTASSGLLNLISDGNDANFLPPSEWRDPLFAAAENALAAAAQVQGLLAQAQALAESVISDRNAVANDKNAISQTKEEVSALKSAVETDINNANIQFSQKLADTDAAKTAALDASANSKIYANNSKSSAESAALLAASGIRALQLKTDRDAVRLNGGSLKILQSGVTFDYSAPISFAITLDIKRLIESTNIGNVFFNSYVYAGCGIFLVYQQQTKRYFVAYGRDNSDFYFKYFTFDDKTETGLQTFVLTFADEFIPGLAALKTNLWKNDVLKQNGVDTSRTQLTAVDIPFKAGLRIGGGTSDTPYITNWYLSDAVAGMDADLIHFGVYKRLLTDSEAVAYNRGVFPKGAAIELGKCAGAQWRDESGNGFHASVNFDVTPLKIRDTFVNDDILTWTASGTKYFISSTQKVLPNNCRFNVMLTSDTNCTASLKNGAGVQYASVTLAAGVPFDAGTFINSTDGKLSLTPNISSVTIKANLEIRKF